MNIKKKVKKSMKITPLDIALTLIFATIGLMLNITVPPVVIFILGGVTIIAFMVYVFTGDK